MGIECAEREKQYDNVRIITVDFLTGNGYKFGVRSIQRSLQAGGTRKPAVAQRMLDLEI